MIKPVSRIFEVSDSNPIRGRCERCIRPAQPKHEETSRSKNAENEENARSPKRSLAKKK